MGTQPKTSICMPILNAGGFLRDRVETIMSQTCEDWELIVSDNFSDDGSWELLQEYAKDPRVVLFQSPRTGMYGNWNNCLRRARGKYVYIATADDTMSPGLIAEMVGALENVECREWTVESGPGSVGRRKLTVGRDELGTQSSLSSLHSPLSTLYRSPRPVDIAVCGFDVIDEGAGVVPDHSAGRWPKSFYGDWMSTAHLRDGRTEFILHACLGIIWWTITAVVFRRSLLDRIGLFRTDRGSQADEEWEMRAALASDIAFVPEKLATWRVHGDQATGKLKSVNRTNLDCLEAVLNDDAAGIPDDWKRVPRWREKITHICRTEHLDSFGLYRNVLRRNPKLFINALVGALRREPGFALRQAVRGFPWSPGMSPDPIAYARELIELLGCAWPPRDVGSGL